jgi:hypothetical protein
MRFFTGFLLGLSVGTVFAFPMLIWFGTLVARLFDVIGLQDRTYLQFLTLFMIVYSALAACAIRVRRVACLDSIFLGFLSAFSLVSLSFLVAFTIGEDGVD